MVALRSTLLASLLFATSVVAQEPSAAADPAAPADGVAEDGDGTGSSGGSSGGWNNATYFLSPSRGQQDYWVNGIENTAYWNPVQQPTYLTISNSNLTSFNGTRTLGEQIPGGTGSYKVQLDDYPVGTNYVLALLEQGTQRKLAQSQGFWIKIKGTAPATADGAQGAASAPVAGAGTEAGATSNGGSGGAAPAATGAEGGSAAPPSGSAPATSAPASSATGLKASAALVVGAGVVALLI